MASATALATRSFSSRFVVVGLWLGCSALSVCWFGVSADWAESEVVNSEDIRQRVGREGRIVFIQLVFYY